MGNNTIGGFFPDEATKRAFMESTIKSCNDVIAHYDFVLNDISSDITNETLEKTKGPAISFLKAMRAEWIKSRDTVQTQLNNLK